MQKNQEFKVMPSYIVGLRLAWTPCIQTNNQANKVKGLPKAEVLSIHRLPEILCFCQSERICRLSSTTNVRGEAGAQNPKEAGTGHSLSRQKDSLGAL